MRMTIERLEVLEACEDGILYFKKKGFTTVEEAVKSILKTKHKERFNWSSWLLSKVLTTENQVKFAVNSAELVLPIWEEKYPKDKRPIEAIEAAKEVIVNPTSENKEKVIKAARAAYWAAYWAASNAAAYWAARAAEAARATDDTANFATARATLATARAVSAATNKPEILTEIIKYGLKLLKD